MTRTGQPAWTRTAFVAGSFLSAFLLFQVQPLVGKAILPWFGGVPAVWITCLLFFQALLLAGYLYAHLSIRWIAPRAQGIVHGLILAAAWMVSILPADSWKPEGDEAPLSRILWMLLVSVGPGYFALAATAPLLQAWFVRAHPGRAPYPLYALSNAGSLMALGSYPLLVEPSWSIDGQAAIWSWVYLAFVPIGLACAWAAREAPVAAAVDEEIEEERPPMQGLRWVAWSATGVMLLMAVTNQLTLNIAAVPFLWVVPLGLYLFSFILAFSGRGYPRRWMVGAMPLILLLFYFVLQERIGFASWSLLDLTVRQQVVLYGLGLLAACLVCHGELHRLRPAPARLTSFYLSISAGGVLGGFIIAVLSPRSLWLEQELQLGMLVCAALLVLGWVVDAPSPSSRRALNGGLLLLLLAFLLYDQSQRLIGDALLVRRNFFGQLRVHEERVDEPLEHRRSLLHGSVLHGTQYVSDERSWVPTTYYTPMGGGGAVLLRYMEDRPRQVGLIGLGVGTLATYGKEGDRFRFYEIDPDVVEVARTSFRFLEQSKADCEVAVGDARLLLEREEPQNFDLLVLDAFGSDAVPVHLLNLDAFRVYERHLRPGGVIAAHVSNQSLDLTPVVYNLADALELNAIHVASSGGGPGNPFKRSDWMILTRDTEFLGELLQLFRSQQGDYEVRVFRGDPERYRKIRPWTDRYSNLIEILK